MLGQNLINPPYFARVAPGRRVGLATEIALRQFVQVLVGAFLRDLDHLAAHQHVAVRVVGVGNLDGYFRPLRHRDVFQPAFGRIHNHVLAVVIDPDGRDVRRAVG